METTSAPPTGESSADHARLAVVIPAYNADTYLGTALAGVAAQTRPPDQVVIVDDASTDGTGEVARRWSALLPIELITFPENRGIGAARKVAVERSSAERIALLDADDYWLPDHLEVMVDHHDRHGGLVTPNHYRWVPGALLGSVPSAAVEPVPEEDDQLTAILRWNFLSYGCVFWRRDYERAGGFREFRSSEDWDLWIRMVQRGVRVSRPETVTLIYRKRVDSLSATDQTVAPNISILEELVHDEQLDGRRRAVAAVTLRRFRARKELLEGMECAAAGEMGRARRLWVAAAVRDRSLRIGKGIHGSTTLRALLCLVAPGRAGRRRAERISDPHVLTRS